FAPSPLPLVSTETPRTQIATLSLHDALPIYRAHGQRRGASLPAPQSHRGQAAADRAAARDGDARGHPASDQADQGVEAPAARSRSEEHTSELQSRFDLVCRLLLEKKKHTTKP